MDDAQLAAYLERIGVARPARPDLAALAAIQWGHVTAIPFENLDILLGKTPRLDVPSLVDKLVERRRGGYCFEHNTLLAAGLEQLGFPVTRLAARVRWLATGPTPRTHMLLAVEADGERWLVDAGFGGACPTAPLRLAGGTEAALHHDRYRLLEEGAGFLLQMEVPAGTDGNDSGWADLYAFTLEPQLPIDYEVANHYTATHPASRFTQGISVARTRPDGRVTLRGSDLARRKGGLVERIAVEDPESLLVILDTVFGLPFPSGTRFGRVPSPP